jgi:hypothetical protein
MSTDFPDEFSINYQLYFDDGFEIAGSRYKHLNNWMHLGIQLFEAKSFLELAECTGGLGVEKHMDETLIQQSLFRSFVLSYAKCFTSSGKGRSTLDRNNIFSNQESLPEYHDRIMDIRHKFAAHSDVSDIDRAILVVRETDEKMIFAKPTRLLIL